MLHQLHPYYNQEPPKTLRIFYYKRYLMILKIYDLFNIFTKNYLIILNKTWIGRIQYIGRMNTP